MDGVGEMMGEGVDGGAGEITMYVSGGRSLDDNYIHGWMLQRAPLCSGSSTNIF